MHRHFHHFIGRHRGHHGFGHFGKGFMEGGGLGGRGFGMGRKLASADLQLLVLKLLDEKSRYGYEIIKLVEEKTAEWYSPSPGIVYPTLTYLEEAGYVTAAAEGSKKLYTITDEGRAYLAANRELVDVVLARLAAVGERVSQWQRDTRGERSDRRDLPPLTQAALDHLRETIGKRLKGDAEAEAHLVEILARAAADMQRK